MLSSNNTLRRPRILFFYPPRMIPVRRSSTFRSAFIFALEVLRTCRRSKVILTGYFSIFILERNNNFETRIIFTIESALRWFSKELSKVNPWKFRNREVSFLEIN